MADNNKPRFTIVHRPMWDDFEHDWENTKCPCDPIVLNCDCSPEEFMAAVNEVVGYDA